MMQRHRIVLLSVGQRKHVVGFGAESYSGAFHDSEPSRCTQSMDIQKAGREREREHI